MNDAHWIGSANFSLRLPSLDLEHPTDPKNYVNRDFARGTPLYWRDDVTGQMDRAVMAYLHQTPTTYELKLVIAYIQYHIHAPCWLEMSPWGEVHEDMAAEIRTLRELSLPLQTLEDVNRYIHKALNLGLDPL